ncbi:hypothetical protein D3C86_1506770 [compost metagenome]
MRIAHRVEADARTAGQQVQKLEPAHRRQHLPQFPRLLRQSRAPCLKPVRHPPTGGAIPHPRRKTLQPARRQAQLQRREVAVARIEDLQGHGVNHRRQGGGDIALHGVPQPHGLVGRQVDEQTLGQGCRTFIRLSLLPARAGVISLGVFRDLAVRAFVRVPRWRRRQRRILGADQTALEPGQSVVAEHDHDPGPQLGLGRVVVVRAIGLQGLVDDFEPGVRLGRQNLNGIRLGNEPVVFLRQSRHLGRVGL